MNITTAMGVDISTKTGIVVLHTGRGTKVPSIHHEEEYVAEGYTGMARAIKIAGRVALLDEHHQPEVVVMEGYAFSNRHTLVSLVEIGTMVRYFLGDKNVRYHVVAPTQLKKFVTGSGAAKKERVLLEVFKRWGYECQTNNTADAFVLAAIGLALRGGLRGNITKAQQEVLDKVSGG
jgi:crossover junction endodeoxyribonuclease RuvC